MGMFGKLFAPRSKGPMIDAALQHMSRSPSVIGTAYKEISYNDVVEYIQERNCTVTSKVDKGGYFWCNFLAQVNGETREVWLDKTREGGGSVLTLPPK